MNRSCAPSEQLFSSAGDIYNEKRNHLVLERDESLMFVKRNFPYQDFHLKLSN